MWAIYGRHTRKWFSSTEGWVIRDEATQYTWEQKQNVKLPFAGVWVAIPVPINKPIGFISREK